MSSRAKDFRPSRRHGSDDDNFEPPSRNFGYAPPRGPQFDSPSGPTFQATVKWYNPDKGFGFVELFVHASTLERSGIMGLAEGQRVPVDAAQGQKGPEAVNLRLA
jgi:cold shock protein